MRLGLRWLAHQPRDARTLYKMSEPPGSLTSGEQLGPTREELESQAWTPVGPANALRRALRLQTHGEPDEDAFGFLRSSTYLSDWLPGYPIG